MISRAPIKDIEKVPIQVFVKRLTQMQRAQVRNHQLNYNSDVLVIIQKIMVEDIQSQDEDSDGASTV